MASEERDAKKFERARGGAHAGAVGRDVYRAIQAEEFPAVRVRGRYLIPMPALDDMEEAAVREGRAVDASEWVVRRRTEGER